ncbi:MAG TPA: hypothetical protein VJ774_04555 [Actinomycetota bacterium]|nr:hypothetical protein [Actinomycetota bacterium]
MQDAFADLERAREAVVAEGAAFTDELEPFLRESLRRGFERLCADHAHFVLRLDDHTHSALKQAAERSIDTGVAVVIERLRSPEIWLAPLTAPHLVVIKEEGWPDWLPEGFARLLRQRRRDAPTLGELDDPSNRIWVAISAAAKPLEPVLEEFGFRPGRRRFGGRFGLGPKTLPQLDPTGALQRRWRRYRVAFDRMTELASEA